MKKFLIIIPILFLAAACNKQTAQVQPAQNQQMQTQPQVQQPQATSTDENTSDWKTFTSPYGYTLKYPDGWQVYDSSSSNPVYNQKYGAFVGFGLYGPWRDNLPGSTGKAQFNAGAGYDKQSQKFILNPNSASFIYPHQPGAQAPDFVNLDASYIQSSADYKTTQLIISTAQLTK